MPGKGTTDAIFVVRQVQERFMDNKKPFFFAYVDLKIEFLVLFCELSAKGLKVNTKKTKIMISKPGAGPVQKTGKYPCSVCLKGVGSNSIQCTKCKQWVHARCSHVKGKLAEVKDFVCNSCSSPPLDTCEEEENIVIGNSSYEVVQQFCYLGDMLSAGGGAEASSATRTRCAWKKFRELLPILSSCTFSLKKKGSFYQALRPVLLYGSETRPVKEENLVRLHRTEMSMLRWMSHDTFKDRIPSKDLLTKFDLLPVKRIVQRNRLRWFGHVMRMDNANWVKKCMMLKVNGRRDPGRPKQTWEQVIASGLHELGVTQSLAQDRLNWRKEEL